jgi:hypothetical protein
MHINTVCKLKYMHAIYYIHIQTYRCSFMCRGWAPFSWRKHLRLRMGSGPGGSDKARTHLIAKCFFW